MKDMAQENLQSMMFVDASLGLISPNVRCAAFAMQDERTFRSHFVLRSESLLDRAAIKLIVENFWAKQKEPWRQDPKVVTVECDIVVSDGRLEFPMPHGLLPFFIEFNGDDLLDAQEAA